MKNEKWPFEPCGYIEVLPASERRNRLGHVDLAVPVCHAWFLRCRSNPMALILDVTPRRLERVIYSRVQTGGFLNAVGLRNAPGMLAEAAVMGKTDHLTGVRENVILGRIVPAGTGFNLCQRIHPEPAGMSLSLP